MPENTFEEIAEHVGESLEPNTQLPQAAPKPDLATLRLEGDEVPEPLRGKSVGEVTRLYAGMQESLRISEEARRNAAVAQPTAPVSTPAVEEHEPTDDEIKAVLDEDQFKGYQMLVDRQTKRQMTAFQSRIQPLAQGNAIQAEQLARSQFPEEFEVLGSEIQNFISNNIPDRSLLANPGAYEKIVKYVRGENFDKLYEARQKKTSTDSALSAARQREAQNAAPNLAGNNSAPRKLGELDATQKEIAKNLQISEEDYRKYYM